MQTKRSGFVGRKLKNGVGNEALKLAHVKVAIEATLAFHFQFRFELAGKVTKETVGCYRRALYRIASGVVARI